ncbi:MAG: nucleotidyltransferase family protein, partial [Acetobacteraceae bacterium]
MNEKPTTPEFRLLLACSSVLSNQENQARLLEILTDGIDWTLLAKKSVEHGLAGLVGQTLNGAALDMMPHEIRDAFFASANQTRQRNRALFDELAGVAEVLANNGVRAIAFGGPVLALQAYGDLGRRVVRELEFLIRDPDIAQTISTLRGLGYERRAPSNAARLELIQRLQGHEALFKKALKIGVKAHTRLAPLMLDIDYEGLWHRAQRTTINGRALMTLAPEDEVLALAVHGGQELWWSMGRVCDVAHFIGSHPNLDWTAILERARTQGCLRMVLLAA